MHPDKRETNVGAKVWLKSYAEHASDALPREKAEARAPDPIEPATTVCLAAAEEVPADTEFAAASVGLRSDFEVDRLPATCESTPPALANVEESFPARVGSTLQLALARATALAFDGVLEELCQPSCLAWRDSVHKCAHTTCFKTEFELEAWLRKALLMYHCRTH